MGYFFLLRRSEYLSIEGKEQWFIIRKFDVTLSNEHGDAVDNPWDATRSRSAYAAARPTKPANQLQKP